jgi:hypothetical protein
MESSYNLRKKNIEIMGKKFWDSFGKVMELDSIEIDDKLSLVDLKFGMIAELDKIQEAMNGSDQDKTKELMDREYTTQFKPITIPLETLCAEDLFQLKGIINMEKK